MRAHSTLIVFEPRRTSMRIAASIAVGEIFTGSNPPVFSTGTLGVVARVATSEVLLSACSTRRRSSFAFSPRARATAATDTPGC
jgi:tRNA A37 threonylcarbamoyladenosine modification protein TsaB